VLAGFLVFVNEWHGLISEPDRMRLCMDLYKTPHRQVIVQVAGKYYVANQDLGLREANDDDLDRHPELNPPEWLVAAIAEGQSQ
jgi:hypothetical protein